MNGWKIDFLWDAILSGAVLVLGRVFSPAYFVAAFGSRWPFLAIFVAAVKNNCSLRPGWVCTRRRSGHKVLSTTCIKHRPHIERLWISKIVPAECMKGWWRIIWACAPSMHKGSVTFYKGMLPHLCAFGMASLQTWDEHVELSFASISSDESRRKHIVERTDHVRYSSLRYPILFIFYCKKIQQAIHAMQISFQGTMSFTPPWNRRLGLHSIWYKSSNFELNRWRIPCSTRSKP